MVHRINPPHYLPYFPSSDRVAYPLTVKESHILKILLGIVLKNIFLTPHQRVKSLINQYL